LNAANNLDNGKPMDIPEPLLNPKEIAAMVIEKQKKSSIRSNLKISSIRKRRFRS